MIPTVIHQHNNGGLRMMVGLSAVIHVCIYLVLLEFNFPTRFKEAPVYYVDVLNLPVANPQAGAPATGEPAPPSPRQTRPADHEMTLPAKAPQKAPASKPEAAARPAREEPATNREFDERIARMEREVGARNESAALDALRKRVAGKGRAGMPGAAGTEAGSDYGSYIRSRLEDAFRAEDTFKPDKSKIVAVRLIINRMGKIASQRIEKISSDKMFNDAVMRAISRAERGFRPPPGGGQVELSFVFKPQEVGRK